MLRKRPTPPPRFQVIDIEQASGLRRDQAAQPLLPPDQSQLAEVPAVQMKQVERIEVCRLRRRRSERRSDRPEESRHTISSSRIASHASNRPREALKEVSD